MTKQFTFTKTAIGWVNIRPAGTKEIIANVPPETMKRFIKGYDNAASFGCFSADINELKGMVK